MKNLPDGQEKYESALEFQNYIGLYSNVIMAKELGIKFSVDDFTAYEIKVLSLMHRKLQEKRMGNNGNRQDKPDIRHPPRKK